MIAFAYFAMAVMFMIYSARYIWDFVEDKGYQFQLPFVRRTLGLEAE